MKPDYKIGTALQHFDKVLVVGTRQCFKTTCFAKSAISHARYTPNTSVLYIAPRHVQCTHFIDICRTMSETNCSRDNNHRLSFGNGSSITAVTGSDVRGRYAHHVFIDDADFNEKPEEVMPIVYGAKTAAVSCIDSGDKVKCLRLLSIWDCIVKVKRHEAVNVETEKRIISDTGLECFAREYPI